MRKKSGFIIVEQAVVLVPDFKRVVIRLEQQVTLRGQSKSTLHNYIRRIALFVVARLGKTRFTKPRQRVQFVPCSSGQPAMHRLQKYTGRGKF